MLPKDSHTHIGKKKRTYTLAEMIDWCFTEERRQECLNQMLYRLSKAKEFAEAAEEPAPPIDDIDEDEFLATKIFGAAGSAEAYKSSWDSGATFGMSQKGDNPSREYVGETLRIATGIAS